MKPSSAEVLIRSHRPGDIGWITHRHGVLYHAEYGWDATFEAMVARVAADFIDHYDPASDRAFIAERGGAIVGSAIVVRKSEQIAKLRLVYVEPTVRGLGVGRRLLDEAMGFARAAGYRRMTLWTNDILLAARRLYETAVFGLVASEPYRGFGRDLVGETWERDL